MNGALGPAVRAAVREADASLVADAVTTMQDRLLATLARPRLYAALFAGFATVALVVAAVGLFGMLTYTVTLRSRELALRMALGARRGDIIRLVLRQTLALTAAGLVAAIAYALSPFSFNRLIGNYGREDFALPILFLSFAFLAAALCAGERRRRDTIASAVLLVAGLAVWHVSRFHLLFLMLAFAPLALLFAEDRVALTKTVRLLALILLLAGLPCQVIAQGGPPEVVLADLVPMRMQTELDSTALRLTAAVARELDDDSTIAFARGARAELEEVLARGGYVVFGGVAILRGQIRISVRLLGASGLGFALSDSLAVADSADPTAIQAVARRVAVRIGGRVGGRE